MDIAKRAVTGTYRPWSEGTPLNELQRDKYMSVCSNRLQLKEKLDELDGLLTGLDDLQKLSLIFNMVTTGVTYDLRAGHMGTWHLLRTRRGVCDDISEAMVVLAGHCCHDSAIYRIVGWQRGDACGHGWNVVELNTPQGRGVWFLDATGDLGGYWRHFLIGTKTLDSAGVRWSGTRFPEIDETDSKFKPYRNAEKEKELAAWLASMAGNVSTPDKYRQKH